MMEGWKDGMMGWRPSGKINACGEECRFRQILLHCFLTLTINTRNDIIPTSNIPLFQYSRFDIANNEKGSECRSSESSIINDFWKFR